MSEPISFLQSFQSERETLSREFECEFELWRRDVDGVWNRADEESFDSDRTDISESIELLENAYRHPHPTYAEPTSDNRIKVCATLKADETQTWAAVGHSPLSIADVTARLVERIDKASKAEESIHDLQDQIRLFAEQMSHKLEEISWLRALASNLEFNTANSKVEDVAQTTFPALREVVDAEAIALVQTNKDASSDGRSGDRFKFPIWVGRSKDKDYIEFAKQISGFLERATPYSMGHAFVWNRDGVTERIPQYLVPDEINSCVIVRIQTQQHDYGWLVAINKNSKEPGTSAKNQESLRTLGLDEFGTIEASLLEAAAGMLATHAANVRLFSDQQEMTLSVIRSLINVVDARDRYTCGHSDRVALMAKSLAGFLGLEDEEQETIYLSGLLHDIGKVAVPDEILHKTGPLSDEEFAVIKLHPEWGAKILQHIQQISHVLPGVLHHHEAINGSGYPHGLSGERIPLMGRIISVVDGFDAMTTTRPYRKARTHAEAIAILMDGAGEQWDAHIVEVFLANLDSILDRARNWEHHISQILSHSPDSNTPVVEMIGRWEVESK